VRSGEISPTEDMGPEVLGGGQREPSHRARGQKEERGEETPLDLLSDAESGGSGYEGILLTGSIEPQQHKKGR